jgi:hypothetical protein
MFYLQREIPANLKDEGPWSPYDGRSVVPRGCQFHWLKWTVAKRGAAGVALEFCQRLLCPRCSPRICSITDALRGGRPLSLLGRRGSMKCLVPNEKD